MEVSPIFRKVRSIIGLIGCVLLCLLGISQLIAEDSNGIFIPILFAVGGFIGTIAAFIELRKINT